MPKAIEIPDPQGGRNLVRQGDAVRVTKGGTDAEGFRARFVDADLADDGTVVAVTVYGGRGFRPEAPARRQPAARAQYRVVRPERLRRMSQATLARKAGA